MDINFQSKSHDSRRRRVHIEPQQELNRLIKENKRNQFIKVLINKYFNKICNRIINENAKGKSETMFFFNYYDFINQGLGHPALIMNEIVYEMCYEHSEYVSLNQHGNVMTLKTLFGNNFNFQMKGKNCMLFKWNSK